MPLNNLSDEQIIALADHAAWTRRATSPLATATNPAATHVA